MRATCRHCYYCLQTVTTRKAHRTRPALLALVRCVRNKIFVVLEFMFDGRLWLVGPSEFYCIPRGGKLRRTGEKTHANAAASPQRAKLGEPCFPPSLAWCLFPCSHCLARKRYHWFTPLAYQSCSKTPVLKILKQQTNARKDGRIIY